MEIFNTTNIPDKTYVIGDVHLGRNNNDFVTFSYTMDMFRKSIIPQMRISKSIGEKFSLVFMGDIFHSESYINTFIGSQFKMMIEEIVEEFGIYILFMVGNHDSYTKLNNNDSGVNFFGGNPNIIIIRDTMHFLTESDKKITFISYTHDSSKLVDKLPENKYGRYLFLHSEIDGFVYKGEESSCVLTPNHLSDYKMVINGHIHGHLIKGNIFLTGSLEQNNFGEDKSNCNYFLFDFLEDSYVSFPNTISPKYIRLKGSDVSKMDPQVFDSVYDTFYVRIYCDSETEKEECLEVIKDSDKPLSIKILMVREVIKHGEKVKMVDEFKSVSDDLNISASTLASTLIGTSINGEVMSKSVVDKAVLKINSYHESLKQQ